MKINIIAMALCIASSCVMADEQKVAPSSSITIEVKEAGTVRSYDQTWSTDYGSYERNYRNSKSLVITSRNVTREMAKFNVKAYFMGKQQATGELAILEMGGFDESVNPISSHEIHAESGSHKENVLNLSAISEQYFTGFKIDGWIVTAATGSNIFFIKTSKQSYMSLLKNDPNGFAEMVNEFEKNKARKSE